MGIIADRGQHADYVVAADADGTAIERLQLAEPGGGRKILPVINVADLALGWRHRAQEPARPGTAG